ncbi:MAG: outer membrane lipoprotein carrier protein LolA [Bacteroidales bacterium]|nr:outer membrane lipoprotein carrier protein LolA [Bacteroidales bacterium]MDD3521385.1 outer membrane lipoprotein carrier protein LolA [Bacteroidales bacterium]MDD4029837.1 outer membrane lipoprotein carrier protein LolA [Bacteroidales bacterium]MDD4434924.1 outer membrane lipoprotein carrier protein LolA [Bacteroidales bacterium]MDD5732627.1 outer membrane lipoprotein carrier protein LolA [Bacteroidales bacterium]
MKRILFILVIALAASLPGMSQGSEEQFYKELARTSSEIESMSGSFIQTKEFSSLEVKVVSKGTFRYLRSREIHFDYTVPYQMSIVVDDLTIKITTREKTTTYPLKDQKNAMAEMARIMNYCMKGLLHQLKASYDLAYTSDGPYHRVAVTKQKDDPGNTFDRIDLKFAREHLALEEMVIYEKSGYVTTYVFSGLAVNVAL